MSETYNGKIDQNANILLTTKNTLEQSEKVETESQMWEDNHSKKNNSLQKKGYLC